MWADSGLALVPQCATVGGHVGRTLQTVGVGGQPSAMEGLWEMGPPAGHLQGGGGSQKPSDFSQRPTGFYIRIASPRVCPCQPQESHSDPTTGSLAGTHHKSSQIHL